MYEHATSQNSHLNNVHNILHCEWAHYIQMQECLLYLNFVIDVSQMIVHFLHLFWDCPLIYPFLVKNLFIFIFIVFLFVFFEIYHKIISLDYPFLFGCSEDSLILLLHIQIALMMGMELAKKTYSSSLEDTIPTLI